MNNSYTGENGGRKEVSGKIESRWRISTDVRNALALFIGAVTLLAAVWGSANRVSLGSPIASTGMKSASSSRQGGSS